MNKKTNCKACRNIIDGVKTRKAYPHTCGQDGKKIIELMKTKAIIESGYAGVMSNGNIVDRREHPEAISIPANPLFNTPEPKDVHKKGKRLGGK